jgi:hypothetical protein
METDMTSWFWLNIPACVVVFSAVVGIPLWLVFKQPQAEPDHPRAAATAHARSHAEASDLDREPAFTH